MPLPFGSCQRRHSRGKRVGKRTCMSRSQSSPWGLSPVSLQQGQSEQVSYDLWCSRRASTKFVVSRQVGRVRYSYTSTLNHPAACEVGCCRDQLRGCESCGVLKIDGLIIISAAAPFDVSLCIFKGADPSEMYIAWALLVDEFEGHARTCLLKEPRGRR